MLKDAVKKVSKEYKSICKEELVTSIVSQNDEIEMIQATAHNPRRIAYYRYHLFLSVK